MAEPRDRRRWPLAAEAAGWLALAGLGLRLTTFARLAAAAGRPLTRTRTGGDAAEADEVAWAVDAACRRAPWTPLCFERGLAAHFMLRRRGRNSILCYGARSDGAKGPSAHVWVRLDGRDVVGGAEAPMFALLARFPAQP